MKNSHSLPLCVWPVYASVPAASLAQHAAPAVRIVSPVDDSQRVTLTHTVNPLANAANDRGAAPDGMELNRLQLYFKRTPAQETALRDLIQQTDTPGSPSYHQWLTPDQFGAQFGPSDQDISTIESWLGNHGFTGISNFWNTVISQLPAVSIKGYIPEQPWNNSQYGLNIFNQYTSNGLTTLTGGSGGASNAAVCSSSYSTTTGACTGSLSGYSKPSWQSGTGVPGDGVRDLPDVSLFAANGANNSFYPICATDGDCQTAGLGAGGVVQIFGVGGTSASSPAFAGIMALVVQKYGRQGQADNILTR